MIKKNFALFISLLLFSLPLFAVGISLSPLAKQQYENKKVGIRLEIPGNWKLEETERILSLVLKPRSLYSIEDSVSIVVGVSHTAERNLIIALENDLERLKSASHVGEVVYIHSPQTYSRNNYEAAIVTIEMPVDADSQTRNSTSQPMDIIAINGGDRLIFVYVRKSNTAAFLNRQADMIIQSIEILNPGQ